ncbi:MAG: FIST N-terminal domain-containing protein [Campylobacterota bacterium]|nr:FIST N-terminal domain-containing protein [Campylobacterota bacterium]
MFTNISLDPSLEAFNTLILDSIKSGAKAILVFSCDANEFIKEDLDRVLQSYNIPIFGAIFPQILYKNKKYEKGNAILCFDDLVPNLHIIENISSDETDIQTHLENIDEEFKSMFVFVDAFSTSIDQLISELYLEFGLENNFIGGGAGSLSFEQKPVILTNKGLLEDSAILATINSACGIGVKHGWKSIEGPFQITKADKNTILELDYKPAFEIYREVVENHSNMIFNEDNFFEIAKSYPFGVSKVGNEKVVRDPITVDEGALICVGGVKSGDYVDILNSNTLQLIEAASLALDDALREVETAQTTIFIDCISRVLFMEDEFQQELDVVNKKSENLIGAMTLGEIANTGEEYLEFYNKTAVIGVF